MCDEIRHVFPAGDAGQEQHTMIYADAIRRPLAVAPIPTFRQAPRAKPCRRQPRFGHRRKRKPRGIRDTRERTHGALWIGGPMTADVPVTITCHAATTLSFQDQL
ncbi:hypothetical protein HPB50_010571 [Hyalomma asiaticum]|uniref:Uncharacterized protein n=1 Tax=Hyalomma asiaticum TaxID=266040 RepID=A0ACB7SV07_HYAAI|nr:hypothetical protein HPB50_010571 [Hyalomma asiaticum]